MTPNEYQELRLGILTDLMPTALSTEVRETYKCYFAADTSPYMKGVV